jgi:glyceraldehyde-3-phosphate dehydrogenase/erythrose-4-phosphate dehydrogenase
MPEFCHPTDTLTRHNSIVIELKNGIAMKVGINGMGRIGRLALRAAMGAAERQSDDPRAGNRLEVVHLNELKGGAAATAHLLAFDSVQGKWRERIEACGVIPVLAGSGSTWWVDGSYPDLARQLPDATVVVTATR